MHDKALLIAENAALRAENKHQQQKRAGRKGFVQKGGSMTVQDSQDYVQNRPVEEQPRNNAENIDPALLTEQSRSARVKAPSRCCRCGSIEHHARTCSL